MGDSFASEETYLEVSHEVPATCGEKFKKSVKDNLFTILTLIGVAIGFGIGFGVGTTNPSEMTITWICKSFAVSLITVTCIFLAYLRSAYLL